MTFITLDTRLPPYRHALYAWVPPSPRVRCRKALVSWLLTYSPRNTHLHGRVTDSTRHVPPTPDALPKGVGYLLTFTYGLEPPHPDMYASIYSPRSETKPKSIIQEAPHHHHT